jgi:bromodomain adjacent to zinc finger domain protein 1A
VLLEDYEKLKELDPSKLTVRQKQIVEEKRTELAAKRKEEMQQKEQEFLDEIHEVQSSFAVYPIGRDRLYRRYWMFKSLPGLFVEDEDDFITSDCLKPCPQKQVPDSNLNVPMESSGVQSAEKITSTGSDKENDSFEGKLPNGQDSEKSVLGSENVNKRTDLVNGVDVEKMDVDMKLPGIENNAVDQIVNREHIHWAFYNTVEDLDGLLNSLNPRGARESVLRVALLEQKDRILESMRRCPADDFVAIVCCESHQFETPNPKEAQRTFMNIKSRNRSTQGSVKNNSAQEFIELNLRESLLDLEERIYHGSLGALKVSQFSVKVSAINTLVG